MNTSKARLFYIVGPTAAGKTRLAFRLARLSNRPIEVISADSRQIYRHMNICTGKPTPDELKILRHHVIDIRNPDEGYSVGDFQKDASSAIHSVLEHNHIPLVVGGTGLYIRSLTDGLVTGLKHNPAVRGRLEKRAAVEGSEALHEVLQRVDPETAGKLHANDVKRVIRALEVFEQTGVPLSELQKTGSRRLFDHEPVMLGLSMARETLYERIDQRVDLMLQNGAIEETEQLQTMGYDFALTSMESFGYRDIGDYLSGTLTFEEMSERFKKRSRNYAKRQLTWFRKEKRITWIDVTNLDLTEIARRLDLI